MKLNPKQIHYMFNKYEELKNFNIVHIYNVPTKSWQFHGYACIKCGSSFKTQSAIQNHKERCKYLNGIRRRYGAGKPRLTENEENPEMILDVNGNEWKPFEVLAESYQNFADK